MENLHYYWDLVLVLTKKEMKIRYKSSALGYLWSVINPLAFAVVFYLAFKLVMRIQVEDYAVFLICALFPWQWFSNSVTASPRTFIVSASLIKKTNFPKIVLVMAETAQDMLHFILALPVVVGFLYLYGRSPSLAWIYGVPILLVVQLLLTLGVSLFIASTNLFFRDMERLTATFMMLLFYGTPVIYPITMIPPKYQYIINCNPLSPIITAWRSLLFEGVFDAWAAALGFVFALLAFAVGYAAYRRLYWKFAEVI